jgi:hypothetical protein
MYFRNMKPHETFGSLMDELLSPQKYGESLIQYGGTKENPIMFKKGKWVYSKFKAWHDEDGSYHEELIDETKGDS